MVVRPGQMVIRFLGLPLKEFDELCKSKDVVEITISCFKNMELKHEDGTSTIDKVLTSQWSGPVKSSADIFQFNDEDVNKLDPKIRISLV
jgi:ABC-type antimicrobial peptide transport system ATPase subunit